MPRRIECNRGAANMPSLWCSGHMPAEQRPIVASPGRSDARPLQCPARGSVGAVGTGRRRADRIPSARHFGPNRPRAAARVPDRPPRPRGTSKPGWRPLPLRRYLRRRRSARDDDRETHLPRQARRQGADWTPRRRASEAGSERLRTGRVGGPTAAGCCRLGPIPSRLAVQFAGWENIIENKRLRGLSG